MTIAALGLIATAGVAHAQMQAPSPPEGCDGRSMPGDTSNPNTGLPKTSINPSPQLPPPQRQTQRAVDPNV